MHMCMEFMDMGSLDKVYHRAKKLPEAVAAKIAYEVWALTERTAGKWR